MASIALSSMRLSCDVLIVGGGTAALVAALEARKSVDDVVLACKRKAGHSGNTIVSGAAFSACVPGGEVADTVDQHLQDTLAGGASGVPGEPAAPSGDEDAGQSLPGDRADGAGGTLALQVRALCALRGGRPPVVE